MNRISKLLTRVKFDYENQNNELWYLQDITIRGTLFIQCMFKCSGRYESG